MNSTPFNYDKFAWTDPSQLREVKVSEGAGVPDRQHVTSSAPARVSASARKSARESEGDTPPATGNSQGNSSAT